MFSQILVRYCVQIPLTFGKASIFCWRIWVWVGGTFKVQAVFRSAQFLLPFGSSCVSSVHAHVPLSRTCGVARACSSLCYTCAQPSITWDTWRIYQALPTSPGCVTSWCSLLSPCLVHQSTVSPKQADNIRLVELLALPMCLLLKFTVTHHDLKGLSILSLLTFGTGQFFVGGGLSCAL